MEQSIDISLIGDVLALIAVIGAMARDWYKNTQATKRLESILEKIEASNTVIGGKINGIKDETHESAAGIEELIRMHLKSDTPFSTVEIETTLQKEVLPVLRSLDEKYSHLLAETSKLTRKLDRLVIILQHVAKDKWGVSGNDED